MYKQLIIARKDLGMSAGKLAAQVSHGSMAFLTSAILNNSKIYLEAGEYRDGPAFLAQILISIDEYNEWFEDSFTKVVLEAKNKTQLLKVIAMANELGLERDKDYFLIYDACRTELEPEEENGGTLTVIGFRPLDADIADKIGKKFQLFKD